MIVVFLRLLCVTVYRVYFCKAVWFCMLLCPPSQIHQHLLVLVQGLYELFIFIIT